MTCGAALQLLRLVAAMKDVRRDTCRPAINCDRRMFFVGIDEICRKTNFFARNFISVTTNLVKFVNFAKIVKNTKLGFTIQKHKIRVYDFWSRILLGLTISKRDFFAKSIFFLLGLTISKRDFFAKPKMEIYG